METESICGQAYIGGARTAKQRIGFLFGMGTSIQMGLENWMSFVKGFSCVFTLLGSAGRWK